MLYKLIFIVSRILNRCLNKHDNNKNRGFYHMPDRKIWGLEISCERKISIAFFKKRESGCCNLMKIKIKNNTNKKSIK